MRISTTSCIFYEADELSKIDLATSKLAKTELIPVRRRRR